jgi:hypothetical protein
MADRVAQIIPGEPSCGTCRYWSRVDSTCRRHAPTNNLIVEDEQIKVPARGVWPCVHQDEWCGDYERRQG